MSCHGRRADVPERLTFEALNWEVFGLSSPLNKTREHRILHPHLSKFVSGFPMSPKLEMHSPPYPSSDSKTGVPFFFSPLFADSSFSNVVVIFVRESSHTCFALTLLLKSPFSPDDQTLWLFQY